MAYTALATKVKENNIEVFNNPELGFSARTMLNEDGSISINAEDTARGFGWTQEKNGKTYVRWDFPNLLGKTIISQNRFFIALV